MKSMAGLGAVRKKAYEKSAQEAAETITNMRTVAGLTRERTFIRIFAANNDAPYRYAIRSSLVSGLGYGVSQASFYFVYAIAFLAGGKLIISETYSVQQMFQVMFAVVFAAQALGQTSQVSAGFAKAKVAAVDVFMLLDRTNNKNAESDSGVLTQPSRVSGRDVRFVYPSRPMVPILRGVDFDVLAGKTVALVGPSGCGKSTIIGLVQRLYDADGGRVSVHGVDVRRWNLQQLRATYAIVGQEPVLFDYTVGENISYGLPGATHAQIEQAARDANIHDFIASLPDGYSTRVGEAGSQLSGGQKQRIAIARAIIRNPRLLLLDEATSALDSTSERVVQEALDRAAAGRTTIAIAHRLATVQNADCILVFSNGQIVESGTHRELLALKGLYHSLVQKQSLEVTH
ncbi:ATP-binding cassette, sub-family B, member 1, isoform CRA_b [Ramicandelaber brevisporus]|nr:ATP-binding cassette, sub-family B, member 1, isoform CRA_b [Ramicandelaber brevisporus]